MFEKFEPICQKLKEALSCDFVGLAIYHTEGKKLKWKYAIGNRNEKYKRITVRNGKGIAGQVFRSGTAIFIESFPTDINGKETDYPIMIAEKLTSCAAVPLYLHESVAGVLLVGVRRSKGYTDNDKAIINDAAKSISDIMSMN